MVLSGCKTRLGVSGLCFCTNILQMKPADTQQVFQILPCNMNPRDISLSKYALRRYARILSTFNKLCMILDFPPRVWPFHRCDRRLPVKSIHEVCWTSLVAGAFCDRTSWNTGQLFGTSLFHVCSINVKSESIRIPGSGEIATKFFLFSRQGQRVFWRPFAYRSMTAHSWIYLPVL